MNLHAFPFYAAIAQQDRFRRGCSGEGVFGQLTPPNRFPPFQLRREKTGSLVDCIHVYRLDGTLYRTLLHPAFPYQLHQTNFADFLTYYGAVVPGLAMPCGFYYLGIDGQYSEVFQAATDMSAAVSLSWQNSKPLGGIRYGTGFVQTLHLPTEILEPDYRFEEEGDVNGSEVFVRALAKLSKVRVLESGGVPEYLVDALNAVPLHDDVRVGPFVDLGKLTAKTAWLKRACRANVSLAFEDEQPVLWRECDESEEATEVSQAGFVPDASVCSGGPSVRPQWSNTGAARCKVVAYFTSFAIVESATRNNCLSGGLPQTTQAVSFVLLEGRFESLVSQIDADAQARAFADANKQAFANATGTCSGASAFLGGGPDGLNYFLNATRQTNDVSFPVTVNYELSGDGRLAVAGSIVIPAGSTSAAASVPVDGQPYAVISSRIISTNPASYAFAV